MFKVYANLLPANLLSFFLNGMIVTITTCVSTKNNNTLKIRFTRTTQKAALCKMAKHVEYSEHWCEIVQSYCSIQEKSCILEAYKT